MKRKWLFKDYYDTSIIILALISVVLVLLGFAEMVDLDNPPYNIIDLLLWGVFVVDYGWRFFSSKEKWRFVLENQVPRPAGLVRQKQKRRISDDRRQTVGGGIGRQNHRSYRIRLLTGQSACQHSERQNHPP